MAEVKKIKRVLRVGRAEDSSLSSFVERPVPTEKEVATFERIVGREVHEQEIDSNLSEIYSDKHGHKVDVGRVEAKKKPFFLVRLFRRLLALVLVGIVGYGLYFYLFENNNNVNGLDLKLSAPEKIMAGEEFSYQVNYHNPTKFSLSQVRLELQYPANFIFSAATLAPTSGNYGWDLPNLAPGENASITITGRLIGPPDSVNVITGNLSYLPGTFTSEFKKEVSASTIVSGPGFRVDLSYSGTAFINQDNDMYLVISDIQNNYLGDFNLSFTLPNEANASVVMPASSRATSSQPMATSSQSIIISKSGGNVWQIAGLRSELGRQEVPLSYNIKQKSDNLEIKVRLEKKMDNGESYVFWEQAFRPELVSSDLNLTLFLNGSKNDGAVDFSQPLNYSLTYSNRGINTYKDVVIMAGLSGDFLDWGSLKDEHKGDTQSGTIIWTKNEIPALAEIKPGTEGNIDFSIRLRGYRESDLGKSMSVFAYGQYGINNKPTKGEENKSNTISSKINSDLSLSEKILYFNDDNLPVGSGPLPPRVGEATSVKVYWTVKNNIHELTDARVVFTLPSYVNWNQGNITNVGSLYYDQASHQVIWEIGRLPLSVYRVDSEFSLSLTPSETDRNKILVLSPGSVVSATDAETKSTITKKIGSKTTKLEDDDIAGLNNSGIVQ